jgi:type IV pilus assembly protein PilE
MHPANSRPLNQLGWSLIELLIASTIAALLAMMSLPALQSALLRARRTEAINALTQIQQAQERFRAQTPFYSATLGRGGLELPESTARYRLLIELPAGLEATDHRATAIAQGAQQTDQPCQVMALVLSAGSVKQLSGRSVSLDNTEADNRRCWGL